MSRRFFSLWKSRLLLHGHKSQGASEQPQYVYSPLPASSGQIRLLTLLPGPFGTTIHCQLNTTHLRRDSPPPYEALSYTWGSEEDPVAIHIGEGSLPVTQNLEGALQHFRYLDRPRTLWIDAICVNQQDLDERSQQVPRMGDVFGLAQCVLVWLGLEAEDSSSALRTLHKIGSMIDVDWLRLTLEPSDEARAAGELHWADLNAPMPFKSGELVSVFNLLKRPWFERLWIRQEIALSTEAILVCGSKRIPWPTFRRAIAYMDAKLLNANQHVVNDISKFTDRVYMIRWLCTPSLGFSLWDQIRRSQACKCSDPRDRVYALLSISKLPSRIKIIVDYRKSTEEIYQNLVLQHYTWTLLPLTRCEMQHPLSKRPSWIPNLEEAQLTFLGVRSNAGGFSECLVKHIARNILEVMGIRIITIKTAESITFSKGNDEEIITEIRKFAPPGWEQDGSQVLDTYYSTLFFGSTRSNYDSAGNLLTPGGSKEELRSILDTSHTSPPAAHLSRFLRRARISLQNRSFFWTEDGQMGLGPRLTIATDEIVVFPGCPSPMVLRPSPKQSGRYRVVGECFVHKLMNGEALYGPVPANYNCVYKLDRTAGLYFDAFHNIRSGEFTTEDPRFGLLYSDVRDDGVRRVYPTGHPRSEENKDYIGLRTRTNARMDPDEIVEVMRDDLESFLLE
jgi:hypothetical protein